MHLNRGPALFTVASSVARLGRRPLRAVQAVRLLQAAVPISATFTAPFYIRPDPDEDDICSGHRVLLLHDRTSTTMIYTHVLNRGRLGVRSPLDAVLSRPQGGGRRTPRGGGGGEGEGGEG
jgi:hypothetical protein